MAAAALTTLSAAGATTTGRAPLPNLATVHRFVWSGAITFDAAMGRLQAEWRRQLALVYAMPRAEAECGSSEERQHSCESMFRRADSFFKVIDELEARPLPTYTALDVTGSQSVKTPLGGSGLRRTISSPAVTREVAEAVLAVFEPGLDNHRRSSRRSTFIKSWETAVRWLD